MMQYLLTKAIQYVILDVNSYKIYLCVCVCSLPCTMCSQVPWDVRRGCQAPWNWSCRLQVVGSYLMWVLGTKPWSSARTTHTLTAKQSLQLYIWFLELDIKKKCVYVKKLGKYIKYKFIFGFSVLSRTVYDFNFMKKNQHFTVFSTL